MTLLKHWLQSKFIRSTIEPRNILAKRA
jgi:hypothetical protein